MYFPVPWYVYYIQPRTLKEQSKRASNLVSAEKKRRAKLAALGVEYNFPGYVRIAFVMMIDDDEDGGAGFL